MGFSQSLSGVLAGGDTLGISLNRATCDIIIDISDIATFLGH
jgi:hypothetical protein